MLDHVSIGVRALDEAARFYEAVLTPIGYSRLVTRTGTVGFGTRYASFWLNERPHMAPVAADTGCHIGLRAKSPAEVDEFHRIAVENGGSDDGAPGVRHYSKASVYAAFIRDPDGNRLEVLAVLPAGEKTTS
ncbi:VOC family protein [Rhodoligotrophos defluvii]|uniref:VOC family protein n=1 Tax=Rhodoligotrophos defluvii TaxID=2561934 RepID=UPI0010C9B18C|nr:VOC family protein [Rhodoligotrophos defluvii]